MGLGPSNFLWRAYTFIFERRDLGPLPQKSRYLLKLDVGPTPETFNLSGYLRCTLSFNNILKRKAGGKMKNMYMMSSDP
jgi:hypothetical protein